MPVDFFEKELDRLKTNFNQTFGEMPLCNPGLRIRVIFAIAQMGILQRRISNHKGKDDISNFVKTKDKLNEIFSTLNKIKERKKHGNQKPKSIYPNHSIRRAH